MYIMCFLRFRDVCTMYIKTTNLEMQDYAFQDARIVYVHRDVYILGIHLEISRSNIMRSRDEYIVYMRLGIYILYMHINL